MLKVTRIYRRSEPDILFYHEIQGENPSVDQYMYQNYISTKKIIKSSRMLSDDKLEFRSSLIWESYEDFFDFITDIFLARSFDHANSKKYEDNHGITMQIIIEKLEE
jgi:hypothetical protein